MSNGRVDEPCGSQEVDHARAVETFVRRVENRDLSGLDTLFLFGSVARDEATGLGSDVDFLAIVDDSADERAITDELRDVAYDVMLDHGPVVEVHVLSRSAFERRRERGNPFIRNVVRDGRSYA